MDYFQKIRKKMAEKALEKAKAMNSSVHHLANGEHREIVSKKAYKKTTMRFPLAEYRDKITEVDTTHAHVSINGRTGFVNVKLLNNVKKDS